MKWLRVKNWSKFQHFKDRSPPWIKLYGTVFHDNELIGLSDLLKLHYVAVLILAREKDGVIPNDPTWVRKCACLDAEVDLKPLIDKGFLIPCDDKKQDDDNLRSTCAQVDDSLRLRAEKRRVEKRRDREEQTRAQLDNKTEPDQIAEVASELTSEFMFQGGLSEINRKDFYQDFADALRTHGLDRRDEIMSWIVHKDRRKREVVSSAAMFKFWNHFDWARGGYGQGKRIGKTERPTGGGKRERFNITVHRDYENDSSAASAAKTINTQAGDAVNAANG